MMAALALFAVLAVLLAAEVPIAVALGLSALRSIHVNPVHFGVIMTVNLAIGQITPPVGGKLPLVGVEILALAVVTYVPWLSLWLPGPAP